MSSFCTVKANHIFSAKYINVFAMFQDKRFNVMLADNFIKVFNNWALVRVSVDFAHNINDTLREKRIFMPYSPQMVHNILLNLLQLYSPQGGLQLPVYGLGLGPIPKQLCEDLVSVPPHTAAPAGEEYHRHHSVRSN